VLGKFILKELRQVARDRLMLRVIFVVPLFQLFVLGYAATTDVRNVDLLLCDRDRTLMSRTICSSVEVSPYFKVRSFYSARRGLEQYLKEGKARGALVIPVGFERKIERGEDAEIQVILDGENSNTSSIVLSYCRGIVMSVLRRALSAGGVGPPLSGLIRPVTSIRYNPTLRSINFMLPGIVGVLLTIMTMVLTGLAIVKEKENGTLEQLMVTPLKSWQIIAGKTIPFVLISLIAMSIELTAGILWFRIPVHGDILLFLLSSICFITAALGLGIFISTIVNTQQQALFIAWFFMVVFVLLSGLFFPVENMPTWVQRMTVINPLKYFIVLARGCILKGAGIKVLWPDMRALLIIGVFIFAASALRFHKRVA